MADSEKREGKLRRRRGWRDRERSVDFGGMGFEMRYEFKKMKKKKLFSLQFFFGVFSVCFLILFKFILKIVIVLFLSFGWRR